MLSKADVVLLHAFEDDMLTPRQLKKIQKERNHNSYWIYFLHERPENARPDPGLYDGLFNWTVGYRRDAERKKWERKTEKDPQIRFQNHAERKDKLV